MTVSGSFPINRPATRNPPLTPEDQTRFTSRNFMKKNHFILLLVLGAIVLMANTSSAVTPKPRPTPIAPPQPINQPTTSPT